jgi:50S ribosomal subunit-associated GTPase HflX
MKAKSKKPEFLIGVPDGPIQYMEPSWAKEWINIYNNGGIGYQGQRKPTEAEKADIRKRIAKLQDLLNARQQKLQEAWYLMQ